MKKRSKAKQRRGNQVLVTPKGGDNFWRYLPGYGRDKPKKGRIKNLAAKIAALGLLSGVAAIMASQRKKMKDEAALTRRLEEIKNNTEELGTPITSSKSENKRIKDELIKKGLIATGGVVLTGGAIASQLKRKNKDNIYEPTTTENLEAAKSEYKINKKRDAVETDLVLILSSDHSHQIPSVNRLLDKKSNNIEDYTSEDIKDLGTRSEALWNGSEQQMGNEMYNIIQGVRNGIPSEYDTEHIDDKLEAEYGIHLVHIKLKKPDKRLKKGNYMMDKMDALINKDNVKEISISPRMNREVIIDRELGKKLYPWDL